MTDLPSVVARSFRRRPQPNYYLWPTDVFVRNCKGELAHIRCATFLDVATDNVIGECRGRHRAIEFRKFLDTFDANVPPPEKKTCISSWITVGPTPLWRCPSEAESSKTVLLLISRENGREPELMLTPKEVGVMRTRLEQAGYTAKVPAPTGKNLVGGAVRLRPEFDGRV